jgi:hypothetical protein
MMGFGELWWGVMWWGVVSEILDLRIKTIYFSYFVYSDQTVEATAFVRILPGETPSDETV